MIDHTSASRSQSLTKSMENDKNNLKQNMAADKDNTCDANWNHPIWLLYSLRHN